MPPADTSIRQPRLYLIPVRVVLVTFVVTLLSFAVSLLLGILGILLAAKLRGGVQHPNLAVAYRHIALPAAAMVAAIVNVSATFMEIRHYRQTKALRQLENQMESAR